MRYDTAAWNRHASGHSHLTTAAGIRTLLLIVLSLLFFAPAVAHGATWTVDTEDRTEAEICAQWQAMQPSYDGAAYSVTPSWSYPYATGTVNQAFLNDGLTMINFGRYLAGLPYDVTLDSGRTAVAQHGAVLLAANGSLTHEPLQPSDMPDSFYATGLSSTKSSNIGSGRSDSESFQKSCLADLSSSNLATVGHRRWLLNPAMKVTGIGFANNYHTTYAFDHSRTETVSYTSINWPAAGYFPVEFFSSATPWSITLNPALYDWDTTGQTVKLKRLSDGTTWTFNASDYTSSPSSYSEYFNANFGGYGVSNAFIFRPVCSGSNAVTYSPGDTFEVTLSGGIYYEGTSTPATITYRTTFMTLDSDEQDAGTGDDEAPGSLTVARIWGDTRYETAVELSRATFPSTASVVVLATGEDFADALAGSSLAGAVDGSLLLTSSSRLPSAVAAELKRLQPEKIYILGGVPAVSGEVQSTVSSLLPSASITRLAGENRYETARLIAEEIYRISDPDAVFLMSGVSWPDAASASAFAYATGTPILLTPPSALSVDARSVLASERPAVTYIGGSSAALALTLDAQVAAASGGDTKRFAGENRYDTSRLIAEESMKVAGLSVENLYVATGAQFADALVGGMAAGARGNVLILTARDVCTASTAEFLCDHRSNINCLTVIGGPTAISEDGKEALVSVIVN